MDTPIVFGLFTVALLICAGALFWYIKEVRAVSSQKSNTRESAKEIVILICVNCFNSGVLVSRDDCTKYIEDYNVQFRNAGWYYLTDQEIVDITDEAIRRLE